MIKIRRSSILEIQAIADISSSGQNVGPLKLRQKTSCIRKSGCEENITSVLKTLDQDDLELIDSTE